MTMKVVFGELRLSCNGIFMPQFIGRGMKNGENFSLLYDLADKLNAAGTG